MAKTSVAVKSAWNARNYETFLLRVKKGEKAKLQAKAKEIEKTIGSKYSVNRLILESINDKFPGMLTPLDDTSKQPKHRREESD